MSFGQTTSDPILAQGSQLNARSPSALGIGAASFASFFGQQTTDNRQQNFLSEEKFSEQRYSGKPDGVAEAEPERPKKKSTDNCQQTTDFGPISLRNSEIKNFRILTKNKRPKMKILNKKI